MKHESKRLNKDPGKAHGAGDASVGEKIKRVDPDDRAIVQRSVNRRKQLGERDERGRTPLFYAAERGLLERVKEIIFSFRGTGMFPPRLALITKEDHEGRTAADIAEENGHEEIAQLLRSEQGRMEFFE
jgi:hypothetical protein